MQKKTDKARTKIERVKKALRHEEPDKIPFFEYYWTGFLRRWREELGLPADADPYYYYDIGAMIFRKPYALMFSTIDNKYQPPGYPTGQPAHPGVFLYWNA